MNKIHKTRFKLGAVVLVVSLFLAACTFESTTDIQPDGSGTLETAVGFSAEERENMEEQAEGENANDFCNTSEAAPGSTITEEQRGDETWCVTRTSFDSIRELRGLYEGRDGLRINRLEVVDNQLYYDVDVDTQSESSEFAPFTAVTWTLALPSAPSYHNGTSIEGNTITWIIDPDSDSVNLRAEARLEQASAGGFLGLNSAVWLGLCGGGLAALAVLAIGFFVIRRARQASPNMPAGGAAV